MKRTLLFLLAGTTLTLSAQQGTAWVMGHVGQTVFDAEPVFKDKLHYGLGVGHWYTDSWGLDLRALRTDLNLDKNPLALPSGKETHLLASGLLNLRPGAENWYPYLALGLGGTNVGNPYSGKSESTTRFNYHAGLGLMGKAADKFLLDFSVKAISIEMPSSRTEILATLGLGYTWGGGRKAVPAAPMAAPAPAPAPVVEPKVEPVAPTPPPAPEPPKEIAQPVPPPPPPLPAKIVLDEAVLHFANGKAELGPDARVAIQKVADGLKAYPGDYSLVVSGHTSAVGGRALNKTLSRLRADSVAKVLIDAGIPASRVSTVGFGPDKPIADNATKEGAAKNRRVEIDVKANEGKTEVRKNDTGTVDTPAPAPKKPTKKLAKKAPK